MTKINSQQIKDKSIDNSKINFENVSPVWFSYPSNQYEITAPFNCYIEAEFYFSGWGWAGETIRTEFRREDAPNGLTLIHYSPGITRGHDNHEESVTAKGVFYGAKKGNKYLIKCNIAGRLGGSKNRSLFLRCVPA